jgi:hypothetical protein
MKFEECLSESTPNEGVEKEDDSFGKEKQINYSELAEERGINNPDFLLLIEKAIKQIEVIKPALENLKFKINEIKPDRLILLSKGADLFLNPLKKYFEENKIDQDIECYSDFSLKTAFLKQELDNEFVESYFPKLSSQKIMFVDETFSGGKGALAINEMSRVADAKNVYYFALSQDRDKCSAEEEIERAFSKINPNDFKKDLLSIKSNPNFILNECYINGYLFSKDIGKEVSYEKDCYDGKREVTIRFDSCINFKNKTDLVREKYKRKIPSCSTEEDKKKNIEHRKQAFLTEKLMEEIVYNAL